MADAATVLIPPDNRLLGWGVTDLTLFGGQPVPGMTIGPSTATPGMIGDSAPSASDAPSSSESESASASRETVALLESQSDQPQFGVPTPPVMLSPSQAPDQHGDGSPPVVAQSIGSGSVVGAPLATPLQVVSDNQAAATDSPLAPGAAATTLGSVAPVAPVADALQASTAGTIQNIGTAVAQTLTDPVASVEALGSTLATTIADPADALQTVVGELSAASASVLNPLTQEAGGVLDGSELGGFGGSNPTAGIVTLVGMVESSEAFDLGQTATPSAAAAPSGSILDALVGDLAPPVLLGDEQDGDGSHLLDDHGTHLGL